MTVRHFAPPQNLDIVSDWFAALAMVCEPTDERDADARLATHLNHDESPKYAKLGRRSGVDACFPNGRILPRRSQETTVEAVSGLG